MTVPGALLGFMPSGWTDRRRARPAHLLHDLPDRPIDGRDAGDRAQPAARPHRGAVLRDDRPARPLLRRAGDRPGHGSGLPGRAGRGEVHLAGRRDPVPARRRCWSSGPRARAARWARSTTLDPSAAVRRTGSTRLRCRAPRRAACIRPSGCRAPGAPLPCPAAGAPPRGSVAGPRRRSARRSRADRRRC